MDIPVEAVVAGFTAMGIAIAWLAKDQMDSKRNAQASQKRCEAEGAECRKKQSELDGFIRTKLLGMVEESAGRESATTNELARARRVLEATEKRHAITHDDSTPVQPARSHG